MPPAIPAAERLAESHSTLIQPTRVELFFIRFFFYLGGNYFLFRVEIFFI